MKRFTKWILTRPGRKPAPSARLTIEALEDRRLLSGNPLVITGTDRPEKIVVQTFDNLIEFTVTDRITGAELQHSGDLAANVSKVIVHAAGGDDLVSNLTGLPGELYGEAGNDTLFSGSGDDLLSGGAGSDRYVFSGTNFGSDRVIEADNADADTLDFSNMGPTFGSFKFPYSVAIDLSSAATQVVSRDLSLTLSSGSGIENVVGSSRWANTLRGNARDNALTGGAAADTLEGRAGNDVLSGGAGSDTYVFAGTNLGNDKLVEGDKADTDTIDLSSLGSIFARQGYHTALDLAVPKPQKVSSDLTLTLSSDTGIENVVGSMFSDTIRGNGRDNRLQGGFGDDMLEGRGGNDALIGGSGSDTYVFSGTNLGSDTVVEDGGAISGEFDRLDFSGFGRGVTVDLASSDAQTVGGSDLKLTLSGDNSIENVTGSKFADTIRGNALDNVLDGGDGDDTLEGRGGNDMLVGGKGNDTYVFSGTYLGSDTVNEGGNQDDHDRLDFSGFGHAITVNLDSTGSQTISLGDLRLSLSGAGAIEDVTGSNYDDTILGNNRDNVLDGGRGNDYLKGVAGKDTLIGSAGDDVLDGGDGDDTYVFAGSDLGSDVIIEAADRDTDTLDFSGFHAGVNIDIGQGNVARQVSSAGDLTLKLSTSTSIENVIGSEFADTIHGNDRANLLDGRGGDDTLFTTNGGIDTMYGGAGNDQLHGDYHPLNRGTSDYFFGQGGVDRYYKGDESLVWAVNP